MEEVARAKVGVACVVTPPHLAIAIFYLLLLLV